MSKARGVFWLYLLLALLGAATTTLALSAASANVRWQTPTVAAFIEACQTVALPDTSASSVLALVLGSGGIAVLALAARSATRQIRASRRYLRTLEPAGTVWVDGTKVVAYRDHAPGAFCAGVLRQRIFISTATFAALGDEELRAVVAHERHHARSRDPLRLLIARTVSDALFFLPGMRQLADRYAQLAEVAADSAAVRASGGSRRALAAALVTFNSAADATVVGIAPERVDSLLGRRLAWELPVALITSAIVISATVGAVAVRVADASAHNALDLPLFIANACMIAMAVVPIMIGATMLLRSTRSLRPALR